MKKHRFPGDAFLCYSYNTYLNFFKDTKKHCRSGVLFYDNYCLVYFTIVQKRLMRKSIKCIRIMSKLQGPCVSCQGMGLVGLVNGCIDDCPRCYGIGEKYYFGRLVTHLKSSNRAIARDKF